MKKLIALLMVICIMACGCGKEEPQNTNTTTPVPTQETKPSVDEPKTSTDEKKDFEEELEEWVQSSRYNRDLETYDALIMNIQVALTAKATYNVMKDVPKAYFDIDSTGVTVTNVCQELMDDLTLINPDWENTYMKLDACRITLEGDGKTILVKREKEPVNPLNK